MTHATFINGIYQIAYVASDIGAAMKRFRSEHGIPDFFVMEDVSLEVFAAGRTPARLQINMAHCFVGSTHIELIQPLPGCIPIYDEALAQASDGTGIRFHHIGIVVPSGQWSAFRASADEAGRRLAMENDPGFSFGFCYFDERPTLGHYQEYFEDSLDWRAFMAKAPRW